MMMVMTMMRMRMVMVMVIMFMCGVTRWVKRCPGGRFGMGEGWALSPFLVNTSLLIPEVKSQMRCSLWSPGSEQLNIPLLNEYLQLVTSWVSFISIFHEKVNRQWSHLFFIFPSSILRGEISANSTSCHHLPANPRSDRGQVANEIRCTVRRNSASRRILFCVSYLVVVSQMG